MDIHFSQSSSHFESMMEMCAYGRRLFESAKDDGTNPWKTLGWARANPVLPREVFFLSLTEYAYNKQIALSLSYISLGRKKDFSFEHRRRFYRHAIDCTQRYLCRHQIDEKLLALERIQDPVQRLKLNDLLPFLYPEFSNPFLLKQKVQTCSQAFEDFDKISRSKLSNDIDLFRASLWEGKALMILGYNARSILSHSRRSHPLLLQSHFTNSRQRG